MVNLVNRGQLGQPRSNWSATVNWVDHSQYGLNGHFGLKVQFSQHGLNGLNGQFGQPRSFGSNAVNLVSHGQLGRSGQYGLNGHFGLKGQFGQSGLNSLPVPTIVQSIPCVSAIVQLAYGDSVNRPCNL